MQISVCPHGSTQASWTLMANNKTNKFKMQISCNFQFAIGLVELAGKNSIGIIKHKK